MQNGVLLILLSMSLTPFGDAFSKYLGTTQSPFAIVFLRYFIGGLYALLLARVTRTKVEFHPDDRLGTLVRTALVMVAMTLLIIALTKVPLASAVGGFLIAPIIATMLSVLFMGETLTLPRLFGATISFIGAIFILGPNAGFEFGMVYALLGGGFLGGFLALSRRIQTRVSPVSALVQQCLFGALMVFPFALPGLSAFTFSALPAALGLGFVTAATHFLTVAAYRHADAAKLAPFFYFNLIVAIFVGIIWFGEIPGIAATIGLFLIVAGGLCNLFEPTRLPAPRPFGGFLRRTDDTTQIL